MKELERLQDEIALRQASLADAQREWESGELSESEWTALRRRDSDAITAAKAQIEQITLLPTSERRRPRRRRLLFVSLACFFAAIVIVLGHSISLRQAGQSVTGGIDQSTQQRIATLLSEGESDIATNNVNAAVAAYHDVLQLAPRNTTALSESGWLEFSAGSARHDATVVKAGEEELQLAVRYAPRDPAARLYYAIAAASTPGNRQLAIAQFRLFLRLRPSAAQRAVARPYLTALGVR